MKLTIKPSYEINGSVVTCTIIGRVKTSSEFNNLKDSFVVRTFPTFLVKGIATCQEGDTFNEELGKKIALCRAKKAAYNTYLQQLDQFARHIDNLYQEMEQASDHTWRSFDHESDQAAYLDDCVEELNNPQQA